MIKNKMKFRKGEITKEAFKVIIYDLECLNLKGDKNNQYHYNLLVGNLKDIWGIKTKI